MMDWLTANWKALLIGVGLGIVIVGMAPYARAADLGGNCCSDLEERIAELEVSAARKGNKKVSVVIYGQINKALLFYDVDLGEDDDANISDQRVIDNSANPSFLGLAGSAVIAKDWSAGYVLEVGVGGHDVGYDQGSLQLGSLTSDTDSIYVQRSFVYLKSPMGAVSVGRASQATDDLDLISTANTAVASRPLSFRPITGPQTLEVLDFFDGTRTNLVRYDSPTVAGFNFAASWASGGPEFDFGVGSPDAPGGMWDVAARYSGEFSGIALAGGAGYRHGVVVNDVGTIPGVMWGGVIDDNLLDLDTMTLVGSAKHIASGLFLTGNWGDGDGDLHIAPLVSVDVKIKGWAVTAGIEQKFATFGKTTLYGEYGDESLELSYAGSSGEIDNTYWGLGVVQSIDAAAMDVYLNVRQYEIQATDGTVTEDLVDATVGVAGMRIRY